MEKDITENPPSPEREELARKETPDSGPAAPETAGEKSPDHDGLKETNVPPPGPSRLKKSFPLWRVVLPLLLCSALAIGASVWFETSRFLNTSAAEYFKQEPKTYIIHIEPGSTFDRVAWQIYNEGGISDVWRFRLLARWHKALGAVQAGDFELQTGWTPPQVLRQLVSGKAMLFPLTVKEGLPWWEVAKLIEAGGFAKAEDFKAVIHDPQFLAYYGIPFTNAEGFIFPDTYLLRKPRALDMEQARYMASLLVESFWRKSAPLWAEAEKNAPTASPVRENAAQGGASAPALEFSPLVPLFARDNPQEVKRLVILASLVEEESAVTAERPTVAGVYANRLRLGMFLQCDPTIIYGLGEKYRGKIYRSEIEDAKNPYNTYQHPGLPPGPICSPGLESLRAAFNPEAHSYLYFVATGLPDGTHTFSRTLVEHNKAVQAYRRNIGR